MKPLVLGAAGFLGLNLVDALLAEGITPTCGRRRRTNVLLLRKRPVPLTWADLDDREGLVDAMRGHDVVFHCAAHYPRSSLDPAGALETGLRQLEAALDAAVAAGVHRFVLVSTVATVAPAAGLATEADHWDAAPGFGAYHDLKWATERRALAEERLDVRVVCPGACIGPWDLRVGTSALLAALAWGADPPHADGVVNPVDARDVASALVRVGLHPDPPKRLILAAENLRLHPLMVRLAERYGVRRPSPPLPARRAKALADREEALAQRENRRARMVREIVDLVVHGHPVDGSLASRALSLRYTPFERTLDDFDAWARPLGLLPPSPHRMESR